MDGTLTGTTTPGQGVPGSNGNEGVLHTTQISRISASRSDAVSRDPLFKRWVLPLCSGYSQYILSAVDSEHVWQIWNYKKKKKKESALYLMLEGETWWWCTGIKTEEPTTEDGMKVLTNKLAELYKNEEQSVFFILSTIWKFSEITKHDNHRSH